MSMEQLHGGKMYQKKEEREGEREPQQQQQQQLNNFNQKVNQDIEDVYFDAKHPASFGNPYKLYLAVRKRNPFVTLKKVHAWLEKQPVYTLHREAVLHFSKRKVIVHGPHIQYAADLLDMSSIAPENDTNTFILTVIDCFSRKAFAVPLLNKTGNQVAQGLEKAFMHLGGAPLKLQTDQGKEFLNRVVDRLLARFGTKRFHTHNREKAVMVERFNRTLRTKLQKYFTHAQSLRYIEVLPLIVESYNNSIHSALKKYSPNEVNSKNQHQIFEILYRKYLTQKAKKHKFKFGDIVRVTTYRPTFFKKNIQRNFTDHLFKVIDVLDTYPPTYRLQDYPDEETILGSFYENEMQRVVIV